MPPPPMVPLALFTIHKDKDDDLAFLQCITFTHSFSKVLQAMLKKSVIFQAFLPNKEQCTFFVNTLFFRLFPIISIPQKIFSIFFLTLEKIGTDEKVICYHNISN